MEPQFLSPADENAEKDPSKAREVTTTLVAARGRIQQRQPLCTSAVGGTVLDACQIGQAAAGISATAAVVDC
jgi:hypothetical protein